MNVHNLLEHDASLRYPPYPSLPLYLLLYLILIM